MNVAIIPVRGGSKGIPKKNIMDFCGKPLVAWSITQAKASNCIDEVFVTTDDKEIAAVAEQYGAKIIWRPEALATDTATSESALVHAIDEIEKTMPVEAVFFMQATSPIRTAEDLDGAMEVFKEENADSLFSACVLDDFCVWEKRDNKFESLTYDYLNRGRRQERKLYYLENGSFYIFTPEVLRKHNNRMGERISIFKMPFYKSYEIDSMSDVEICEYFMRTKILK